ncbi:MAG: hypothetical protein NT154_34660 [Verrucomicrobia bacterium]|nr:hypothetical protein [Verrucomicrobiota bacterium]
MKTFVFLMTSGLMLAVSSRASGQVIQTKTDWLIDPAPYRAVVTSNATELVLDNGLARRVIRLAPNAATVDLQNLTSGEHVLRAIAPEARITSGGTEYEIGGLKGQPVNNYLKAEWLDALWANPYAYRFVEWKELPLEARLNWKKRSEWLSHDLPWPPPGRHVVLRFVPPADLAALLGPVVLDRWFEGELQPEWQILKHSGLDRASFQNEGKAGEIMAYKDGAVCAEHPWPAGAVSVELLMDSGDDRADPWGPGLALIVGGKMLKFITNPGPGTFSVNDMMTGTFDRAKPCKLRVTIADGKAMCEASQKEDTWQVIAVVPCPALPTAVRVGKVGLDGSGKDKGYSGPVVRCHMKRVTWRGAEPSSTKLLGRLDLPEVDIHYEIYDGLPLFSKWLVIRNKTLKPLRVNSFVSEELRLANVERGLHPAPSVELPLLHVETDYSFGSGAFTSDGGQHAVSWGDDADYARTTQSGNGGPMLLQCKPPLGPEQDVAAGASFETYRAFELLLDSTERERRGLAMRRMYRTIAPWSQENPLMFHKLGSDAATIREAITQAHEVGFEMVIMSFGSGFNFENTNSAYIAKYKELAEEAKAKGITLGGYSLLASRGAGTAGDNTQGSPAMYGVMPCLGSEWGQWYLGQLRHFLGEAGLGVLEHDGSYPGDKCAATNHPFHHGLEDSQWVQWRAITDLYKWCTGHGVYLNIPDWYFLAGGTKTCLGYRESDWSLPRAEQELIERQNLFDGTWQRTPSMGWMFVPLSEYGGGGAAATIEPLDQHRPHYEARLANLLGYGVQACYRGPRLYDTEATKALVKKWVTFYKTHREVLDGDIIHLRRANGLDWDGILHVNPLGQEKGLLMVYNPLDHPMNQTLTIPLYYTGLTRSAKVRECDGSPKVFELDREYRIALPVVVAPRSHTWFVIE